MSEQIVHFDNLRGEIKLDASEITSIGNVNGFVNKTMDIIIQYIKKNNYELKETDSSYEDNLVSGINRNIGEKRFNIEIKNDKELTKLFSDIAYIMDKMNNEVSDLVIENNLEHTKNINNHSAMISVIPSYNDEYSGWSELGSATSGYDKVISDDGFPLYAVNVKITSRNRS